MIIGSHDTLIGQYDIIYKESFETPYNVFPYTYKDTKPLIIQSNSPPVN